MNEINVYLVPKRVEKPDHAFSGLRKEIEISGLSLLEILVPLLLFIAVVLVCVTFMVVAR